METKIKKTITEWLPEALQNSDTNDANDYQMLHAVSDYCLSLLNNAANTEKVTEAFKVVNMLYQEEHAYTRHCIENEFICNFIENSAALRLKDYLNLMPQPLKEAFIKTLIEL
ncbi:hypothetical protein KJK34_01995 [Flavobacterium sp. D11R37]|uniref:DUF7674 family protein n=1 Tax=Flavobacterium coralii TaxID=2838017 RepID=UPI001CA6CB07|nr:hypothetical protein [Flavobacterium coralii]MBY8961514.1 hypothetical protein [Flavobacterium coralii]